MRQPGEDPPPQSVWLCVVHPIKERTGHPTEILRKQKFHIIRPVTQQRQTWGRIVGEVVIPQRLLLAKNPVMDVIAWPRSCYQERESRSQTRNSRSKPWTTFAGMFSLFVAKSNFANVLKGQRALDPMIIFEVQMRDIFSPS